MSTSRSVRRAAERKARKGARKEAQSGNVASLPAPEELDSLDTTPDSLDITPEEDPETSQSFPITAPETTAPVSEARREANRANAQLSTGPKTSAGKSNSSRNALKTALTGRTVLLPGDDAEHYGARLAEYKKIYQPVGVRETEVVQALCDAWWRLDRIPGLIEALYVKGHNEFNTRVRDVDPAAQSTMLRMETYVAYERQFRNLELQERRLYRHAENLKAELSELRKQRQERQETEYAQAAMFYLTAKHDRTHFDPADLGFDFSTVDVERYLAARRAGEISKQTSLPTNSNAQRTQRTAA